MTWAWSLESRYQVAQRCMPLISELPEPRRHKQEDLDEFEASQVSQNQNRWLIIYVSVVSCKSIKEVKTAAAYWRNVFAVNTTNLRQDTNLNLGVCACMGISHTETPVDKGLIYKPSVWSLGLTLVGENWFLQGVLLRAHTRYMKSIY